MNRVEPSPWRAAWAAALDALPHPVEIFIRDDDAGWDDDRLVALLDAVAPFEVPIDLAVIPAVLGDACARELRARHRDGGVGLHQHGLAHLNHQTLGRRGEFGTSRSVAKQRADLLAGRTRLLECFDDALDPIFTPPWNRCSAVTPPLLAELGYRALSRDRGATPQSSLAELPVDVDWCRVVREHAPAEVGEAMVAALTRCLGQGDRIGLMLHHAAMQAWELELLAQWLRIGARHPSLRWCAMRDGLPVASRAGGLDQPMRRAS